ncbi:MAG: hypothetical protein J6866_01985, partial [Victivallales bacterium]|nr:hypothetical protein [Victivallales bacterium]
GDACLPVCSRQPGTEVRTAMVVQGLENSGFLLPGRAFGQGQAFQDETTVSVLQDIPAPYALGASARRQVLRKPSALKVPGGQDVN